MSSEMQSVLDDWSLPIWLTLATLLTALVYLRGWVVLRATRPDQFTGWRLFSFMSGMASLWLAIGSPLDAFADVLLSAHMIEHLVLMSIVPPLVWLGLPVVPLLRGMPLIVQRSVIAPLLRLRFLRQWLHWLALPLVAWLAMNITFLAWHVPDAYDFALEHERWHDFEHICFLATSILFWWTILRPWPASRGRSWNILISLIAADLVNTVLSAYLAFCGRSVYPFYREHSNPFGIEPLPDQVLGAVIMWVIGSVAFLIPAVLFTARMLQSSLTDDSDPARETISR
jgi:cytochrome c oxidase assembly factor CtaG